MARTLLLLLSCLALALGCTDRNLADPLVEDEVGVIESASVLFCAGATPVDLVNRTGTCEGCNRFDVEMCAATAASNSANANCASRIPADGGDAACDPHDYAGGICVDTTVTGVTSAVQFGSETACGIWPARHAKWRITFRVAGECGYRCLADD